MNIEENIYEKCGEVFVLSAESFTFLCSFCNEVFYEFSDFSKHISSHVKSDISEVIKFEIENLEYQSLSEENFAESENQTDTENSKELNDNISEHNSNENITNLVEDDLNKTFFEELVNCPHCGDCFSSKTHDISKCSKILKLIKDNDGDFIKLLREGILCCHICLKYFNDYKELYHHHTGEGHCSQNTACLVCKFYNFMDAKIKQTQIVNSLKRIEICESGYVVTAATDSVVNNNEKKENNCRFCYEEFSDKEELFKHETEHYKETNPYKCTICGKKFRTRVAVTKHKRSHTDYKPYKCDKCSATFACLPYLKTHIVYKHTDDRPFVCSIEGCEARFKLLDSQKQHEKTHFPGSFQCEKCGNNYRSRSILWKHQRCAHVDPQNWPYQCDICDKRFSQNHRLREHKRIHTGERPYSCKICQKRFRKSGALKEHKKLHSDERKHSCYICGKAFKQKAGYYLHMKHHTDL